MTFLYVVSLYTLGVVCALVRVNLYNVYTHAYNTSLYIYTVYVYVLDI